MTIRVTLTDIRQQLQEAIELRGQDYIYPARIQDGGRNCRYWHPEDDGPGCIVGLVFYRLGATREQLLGCENQGAVAVIERLVKDDWVFEDRESTDALLGHIQEAQDNGATWGYAIRNGELILRMKGELILRMKEAAGEFNEH